MADLHSDILRIASELPIGDPTRRQLLARLKESRTDLADSMTRLLMGDPSAAARDLARFPGAAASDIPADPSDYNRKYAEVYRDLQAVIKKHFPG